MVAVEPSKNTWDIRYSTYVIKYPFGGSSIPYGFKDYITINRHNTSVAMVLTSEIEYNDFTVSDVSTLTFVSDIDALGETWRSGGGPSSGPALYEDRFFVLKDAEENYYKIRFTRLTSTEGERGYPEFTFELL